MEIILTILVLFLSLFILISGVLCYMYIVSLKNNHKLTREIEILNSKITTLDTENNNLNKMLDSLKANDIDSDEWQGSKTPRCAIMGDVDTKNLKQGCRLRFYWNEAFNKYIDTMNITAVNDENKFYKWFSNIRSLKFESEERSNFE